MHELKDEITRETFCSDCLLVDVTFLWGVWLNRFSIVFSDVPSSWIAQRPSGAHGGLYPPERAPPTGEDETRRGSRR